MGYLKNYQFGYGLSVFKSGCGSNKVTLRLLAVALCIPLIAFAAEEQTPSALVYEIAINNGRVIDPETKLDAQRNVGILNGKIATITGEKITAQRTINARGKIVAPGFIDTYVHAPRYLGDRPPHTGLDISNVSLAATGEPLTREKYAKAMANNPGQPVIANLGNDEATRTALTFPSTGIPYVLVNGQIVVENGTVLKTAKAGVGIKHRKVVN